MSRSPRTIWLLSIAIGCVLLGIGWRAGSYRRIADVTATVMAPVSDGLHSLWSFTTIALLHRDLVQENEQLKEALDQATANAASRDELIRENEFLKASLDLVQRTTIHKPIAGSVFAYLLDGGVRQFQINRGSRDGVVVGDAVVAASGALIGVVQEVANGHAAVRSVLDPAVSVTARIGGSEVTGLVHATSRGLILDLVQKDEQVTEGQVLFTSGNDQFPAGLVIGTVSSVDTDSATLFKMVRVSPSVGATFNGRILIISHD